LLFHCETSLFSFFDAEFQSPEHRYSGVGRSGTCVSYALTGVIRTGGDRGCFEYAAALINVNESAGRA
jgi:hypothetical protein